jgi:diguanylate cyclase (GGDEF)-like protein
VRLPTARLRWAPPHVKTNQSGRSYLTCFQFPVRTLILQNMAPLEARPPDDVPISFDLPPIRADGLPTGRFLLAFSSFFGVYRAKNPQVRAEINAQVLRRVSAIGFLVGSLTMAAAAIFADPATIPEGLAAGAAAAYACIALLSWRGSRVPDAAIRFLVFDVTVISLCLIVALGESTGYIALVYFCWPALTSAHFGQGRDFPRTVLVMAIGLAVALAFSDLPIPGVAYAAVMMVTAFTAVALRAVILQVTDLMDQLDFIASTDSLTGLLNRRAGLASLDESVARAHRQGTELAVALFDLDHFKQINDTHGHPAGDAALQRFADVLRDSCSGTDTAVRLGGEEFLVVLLRSDAEGARSFAQRFSDRLDEATAQDAVQLSISAGVAFLDDPGANSDSLLTAADRALYAAKSTGRHRVVAVTDSGVMPLGVR